MAAYCSRLASRERTQIGVCVTDTGTGTGTGTGTDADADTQGGVYRQPERRRHAYFWTSKTRAAEVYAAGSGRDARSGGVECGRGRGEEHRVAAVFATAG